MQPWMNCHPLYAHLTFLLYPPRKQLPGPAILTKKKKKLYSFFGLDKSYISAGKDLADHLVPV